MFGTTCDFTVLLVILVSFVEVAHSYMNYSLESPDLCSLNTNRRISLSTGHKSALIVTQKRLNNHNLEWTLNSICKFHVSVKENRLYKTHRKGIIAVIQKISFRRNLDTGECIDYVQFTSRDGYTSKRFCGSSTAAEAMQPIGLEGSYDDGLAENSFLDVNGEIDVYIFVAKEPLLSHESTDISIVFTAYQKCEWDTAGLDLSCDMKNFKECIYSGFFRDGYYNCPYKGCMDEDGCSLEEDSIVRKDHIGNKVLIGSVTSLLVTFSIFICCIYICRKYGKLCWAEGFARPSIVSITIDDPNQINRQIPGDVLPATPSAPVDDKDLPPSYDSLFPSPPNRQLATSTDRQ